MAGLEFDEQNAGIRQWRRIGLNGPGAMPMNAETC
jgi:hypothetical protein